MKSYKYTGPLSGVSLRGHGDVMLVPGATVQLPGEHGYTERLIRKGWLQEVATEQDNQPEPATDTAPKKKRRE